MSVQKSIAVIILLTSSALGFYVLQDAAFTGILGVIGFVGLKRKYTWDIKAQQRVLSSLMVLLLLAIFSLQYHYAIPPMNVPPAIIAWQTVTRFFLSAMILVLFLGKPKTLPPSLGAFFLATIISAGQVLILLDYQVVYRLLEFIAVILAALYACTDTQQRPAGLQAQHRRTGSRVWVFGIILLLALNTGWMLGAYLYRHQVSVTFLSNWIWGQNPITAQGMVKSSTIGFNESGKLSSLLDPKQAQNSEVQLRIWGTHNPEYFRARGFDAYNLRNSQWEDRSLLNPILPTKSMGFGLAGRKYFYEISPLNPAQLSDVKTLTIQHAEGFKHVMFCPLGSLTVTWTGDQLWLNENNGTFSNKNDYASGQAYEVQYCPTTFSPPSTLQLRQYLQVPRLLDPRIYALAQRILGSCTTFDEKTHAVVEYFRRHYTYSLNVSLPPNEEPLTAFLLHGKQGYCEYFASGTALLLRLADVPTRYMTGFRISIPGDEKNCWIARAMDAHAWVEAWNRQQKRWVIVESTVSSQADDSVTDNAIETSRTKHWFDIRNVLQGLYDYGLVGPLIQFFDSGGAWGLASISFGVLLLLGLLIRYWIKTSAQLHGPQATQHPLDAQVADLHKLRYKVDRRLKHWGQRRPAHESIHQFAQRLREQQPADPFWMQAAGWYQRYNDIRYNPRLAVEQIQTLSHECERLLKLRPQPGDTS